MRAALRTSSSSRPRAKGYTTPAPVGGLNARDSLADMDEKDAVILDNWFPGTNSVTLRKGTASYATGMGTGAVESLIEYASGSAKKFLAGANSALYDVSSSGAVGAALGSGYSNNRWQSDNFKGNALLFNGQDGPLKYDGATVSANAITGPATPANLIHVNIFKSRVFMIEKNTLTFWYLAAGTFTGAASSFDLSQIFHRGGFLMAMGGWARDGANNLDEYAVFITSQGEVAVYQGTDPSNSSAWSLVSLFRIGAPVGRRCFFKFGSDLIAITQDGFVAMSAIMPMDRATPAAALSDKLGTALASSLNSYQINFGWQGIVYPLHSLGPCAVFNVPTSEDSTAVQYVVNYRTQAWCRFTGINAMCWGLYNDKLYYGGTGGIVYQADTGAGDSGANITADAKGAFTYLNRPGKLKRVTMLRPTLASNGTIGPAIEVDMDFEERLPTASPTFTGTAGTAWDTGAWDTFPWGGDDAIAKGWLSVNGLGYCAAIRLRIATNALTCSWQATDCLFEPGEFI